MVHERVRVPRRPRGEPLVVFVGVRFEQAAHLHQPVQYNDRMISMSHFTVLVALGKSVDITPTDSGDRFGLEFALDQVLERFSENREVEPYREYLDGGPEDFWWVQAT